MLPLTNTKMINIRSYSGVVPHLKYLSILLTVNINSFASLGLETVLHYI